MTIFRDVKLGDLFNIQKLRGFNKDELRPNPEGAYDYITRTSLNNGIESVTDEVPNKTPNEPNTYSLGLIQMTFFFRDRPWYAGQFVRKITPKFQGNTLVYLYMLTCLRKTSETLLGVLVRDVDDTFNNMSVKVPINSENNMLDFQYMENKMKSLEQNEIKVLSNYLSITKLSDYQLTSKDIQILKYKPKLLKYKVGHTYYKRKKINFVSDEGLFDIVPTKKKINANIVKFDGKYPYVARGESKNGIRGYINYNTEFLNPANTISFGQDTATMYYQPKDYFTGDKIQIFELNEKYGKLTENIAMYLISSMKRAFTNFEWGITSFALEILADIDIELPVTQDNTIDFEYMEKYIRVIKRLIIKNTVEHKDKMIDDNK